VEDWQVSMGWPTSKSVRTERKEKEPGKERGISERSEQGSSR
jgi:hypothetical protein